MSKKFLFWMAIAMALLGLMAIEPLANPADHATLAWNCPAYSFSVSSTGHVTLDTESTGWNEPAQKADVFINDMNTKVATLDVPATTPSSHYDLGDVPVPATGGFDWKVVGRDDCQSSGHNNGTPETRHNTASLTVEPSCENLNAIVTVTYSEGGSSDHGDSFTVGMIDSAQDVSVVVSFSSGEPLSIPLSAHIPSKEGCPQPAKNTASATVKYNCSANTGTIDIVTSEGGKVLPVSHKVVALTNVQQTFEFNVSFETGEPSTIDLKVPVLGLKKACETKQEPPGNPDHDWCPVGNAINAKNDFVSVSGIAYHAKDYGKGWIALEVQLPYSAKIGSTYTLVYGRNTQTIKVKQLGGKPEDRCEVVSTNIVDPVVSTPSGLRFDESVGGTGSGPEVGSVTVGEKSWTMMEFEANAPVNQQLGYAAYVPLTSGFAVGIHNVEIGSFAKDDLVTINGEVYKITKVKTMSKEAAGRIKTGYYLITCKDGQNLVGFLTKQ